MSGGGGGWSGDLRCSNIPQKQCIIIMNRLLFSLLLTIYDQYTHELSLCNTEVPSEVIEFIIYRLSLK